MLSFNVSSLIFNQATVIFSKGSRPDGCEKALSLYATGSLKVAIGHVFPLERTADTHRVFESRQQFGPSVAQCWRIRASSQRLIVAAVIRPSRRKNIFHSIVKSPLRRQKVVAKRRKPAEITSSSSGRRRTLRRAVHVRIVWPSRRPNDKVEFKLFFPDNTKDPSQYVRGGFPPSRRFESEETSNPRSADRIGSWPAPR
jgi:hypothetical protein